MKAFCPAGHYPAEVLAEVPEDMDPDGLGVIVYGDGSASNRWGDGVAGVSKEIREWAEQDEQPMCLTHRVPIESWD